MPYPEKRGKGEFPWRVRWLLPTKGPNGEDRYGSASGFATKDDAIDYGEDQESDIRHGRWIDPALADTPLREFRKEWRAAQDLAPATLDSYDQQWNKHIDPAWGWCGVGRVPPLKLQAWLKDLTARSPGIARIVRAELTGMFDTAVFLRMIHFSPMPPKKRGGRRAAAGTVPKREGVIVARDEFVAILQRMPTWQDVMLTVTKAFTGMRWSEVANQDRAHLTLTAPAGERDAAGHYVIDPYRGAVHEDTAGHRYQGPPKSGPATRLAHEYLPGRLIDYPPFLALLQLAYLEALPAGQERLYVNTLGDWLSADVWRRGPWGHAVNGVPAHITPTGRPVPAIEPVHRGLIPHDLKHTNKAIMNDKRVHEVMQNYALGHKGGGSGEPYRHPTVQMRAERVGALEQTWREWDVDLGHWGVKATREGVDLAGLTIPLQPRQRRSPKPLPNSPQDGQPALF